MTKEQFQAYIEKQIPIVKAMGILVEDFSPEGVRLQAPLDRNINHRESAFGGSISSLLVLSCWAHIYAILDSQNAMGTIVIQDSQVKFHHPVVEELQAHSLSIKTEELERFWSMLKRFDKARLSMEAQLTGVQGPSAHFTGRFVVVRRVDS